MTSHAQRIRAMFDAAAGLDARIARLREKVSTALAGLAYHAADEYRVTLCYLRAWRLILRLRQRCRRLAQERDAQHAYAVAFSEQCVRFSRHHQQQRERIAELERELATVHANWTDDREELIEAHEVEVEDLRRQLTEARSLPNSQEQS